MPFKSQAQRNLFYAMKADPKLRKEKGVSTEAVKSMVSKDPGGKLPKKKINKPGLSSIKRR